MIDLTHTLRVYVNVKVYSVVQSIIIFIIKNKCIHIGVKINKNKNFTLIILCIHG